MSSVPSMERLTADVPAGEPLDRLAGATELSGVLHAQADELLDEFVIAARRSGASWSEIGAVLGTSKQAAHQRFSAPVRRGGPIAANPTGPLADVLARAAEEARALGHQYVRPEHVLLALACEGDELAGQALSELGVTPEVVRGRIEERLGRSQTRPAGTLGVAPETKRLLARAESLGKSLGHGCPRTEHVLLAAVDRKLHSSAGRVLDECGVSAEQVRATLADLVRRESPELAQRLARPSRGRVRLRRSGG